MNKKFSHTDNMTLRDQIDAHLARNDGSPFRCEINESDAAKFARHAPLFMQAWNGNGDIMSALGVDLERLHNARAANGYKLSADGEAVFQLLSEMRHLFANNDRLQRRADALAQGFTPRGVGSPELWTDGQGRPVEVYAAADSVLRPKDRQSPWSLGDFLNAITTGRNLERIRNDLGTSPDSAGGYSVPEPISRDFIDRLRARSVLMQAGAKTLMMDGKTQRLVRVTADPTVTWRASENAGLTPADPTFGALELTSKTVAVLTKLSIELMQDSVNARDATIASMVGAVALAIDKAALHGVANGPSGLIAVSGRTSVASVGNPSWDAFITGLENLAAADVDIEKCNRWVMSPRTWSDLMRLKTGITNDNTPRPMPSALAGHKLFASSSVVNTLGAGSDSVIFGGDWGDVVLGIRKDVNVRVLNERFADSLSVGLLVYARVDVGVLRPASLLSLEGITNV